jgi:Fe-S cluster assembly scaffold protein SufB
MSTHYGLQINSPFDIKSLTPVAISVKKNETKNIDRGSAVGLLAIIVEEGGVLNYTESILEAGLYHTYVYLQGKNSQANIDSRIKIGSEIADISHQVIHEKDQSTSSVNTRGVIGFDSTVIYTSNISVAPKVAKIGGEQDARFILTSNSAKVKTIPGLSVYSEEVSCSHKVSVAPVDKQALEFLNARGYSQLDAEQLLISVFLN